MEEIDNETGHKTSCKFNQKAKLSIAEIYMDNCKICKIAAPSNKQCCDLKFCNVCWKKFCWLGEWDPDLSRCANYICDVKQFSLEQRAYINQHNIKEILNVQPLMIYAHLSKERRLKCNRLRKEKRSYFPENKKRKECPEETSIVQIPPVLAQILPIIDQIQPNLDPLVLAQIPPVLAQKMKIS